MLTSDPKPHDYVPAPCSHQSVPGVAAESFGIGKIPTAWPTCQLARAEQ